MLHWFVPENSFLMIIIIIFFFFDSVKRPFQDYFSSYETGQSVKRENPEKNHLAHPQAELGLSIFKRNMH